MPERHCVRTQAARCCTAGGRRAVFEVNPQPGFSDYIHGQQVAAAIARRLIQAVDPSRP